jgi:hypothetical protein
LKFTPERGQILRSLPAAARARAAGMDAVHTEPRKICDIDPQQRARARAAGMDAVHTEPRKFCDAYAQQQRVDGASTERARGAGLEPAAHRLCPQFTVVSV